MLLHGIIVRKHDQELKLEPYRDISLDGVGERPCGRCRQRPGEAVQGVRAVSAGGVGLDPEGRFGDIEAGHGHS